jgi:hypothetical protein
LCRRIYRESQGKACHDQHTCAKSYWGSYMFASLCLSSEGPALWCIWPNETVMAAERPDKARGKKARFKFPKHDCENWGSGCIYCWWVKKFSCDIYIM